MSDNILAILEHFKQADPVGLPGAEIPEPYAVPDMKQSLSFATLYFKNTAVYGISKFRIDYVNVEISDMQVCKRFKYTGFFFFNIKPQLQENEESEILWILS